MRFLGLVAIFSPICRHSVQKFVANNCDDFSLMLVQLQLRSWHDRRQLTGPAGRPRMCSYNRMKVNALSQHLSFGMSRGCAAEGVLLDRAACCGRDGDRDLARPVAAGFGVLFLSTMSSSSSVTSASSETDTQYPACSVAPLPTDRQGSSVSTKDDRARDLARDRDASLTTAKSGDVFPSTGPAGSKRTHSGNGGSGGSGSDGSDDDMLCKAESKRNDTLI